MTTSILLGSVLVSASIWYTGLRIWQALEDIVYAVAL